MTELIDNLMDLAKIEAGRRDLNPQTLDLGEVVRATVGLIEQRAAAAGLELQVRIAPDLATLHADSLAVRQILFNLLSNAVKYTPGGGRIELAARPCPDGGVEIAVADTGIGMSEADRASLFQPFNRAARVRKMCIEGSGLGLSLVKALLDQHGGEVRVDSTPGRGSVFTVRFPPPP